MTSKSKYLHTWEDHAYLAVTKDEELSDEHAEKLGGWIAYLASRTHKNNKGNMPDFPAAPYPYGVTLAEAQYRLRRLEEKAAKKNGHS